MTCLEFAGWAVLGALLGIVFVGAIRYAMLETERQAGLRRLDELLGRDQELLDEIHKRLKRDWDGE